MAPGFCSPAHLLPESCSQSPEGSPSCAAGQDQMFSPNTVARGWGSATGAWPGGIAEDQPGLLLSPAGGTSSLTRLLQLLGNAGWPGEHLEAQALPEENLLRGLSRARGQSAAPPHLAHNSTVPNPALHHLPSHQPCQGFCFTAGRAAVAQVLLCFSLPGLQPAERALHQPLRRPHQDCGGQQQETDEGQSANGPAPALLSHE